jgi:hypothetical protein
VLSGTIRRSPFTATRVSPRRAAFNTERVLTGLGLVDDVRERVHEHRLVDGVLEPGLGDRLHV